MLMCGQGRILSQNCRAVVPLSAMEVGSQLVFEAALPPTAVVRREVIKAFEKRGDGVRFSHVSFHDGVGFAGKRAVEAMEMETSQTE